MSGVEDSSEQIMPSQNEEEAAVKKKYGGIMPKKPPLISKDHERAYFDSADWALGKQGVEKPKGPLEALRPKLQPTQQQTRYRNLLVPRQMAKMEEVLRLKIQLLMNEKFPAEIRFRGHWLLFWCSLRCTDNE